MKVINLVGQKFDRLEVIELIGSKNTHKLYLCKCACGKFKEVTSNALKSGNVRSCGCLYKDAAILNGLKAYKGYEDLSLSYWNSLVRGAKERNLSFNITKEYAWGIFEKQGRKCYFTGVALYLSRHYGKKEQNASLDRINNLLGYEENNVRWVTKDINCLKWDYDDDEFLKICNLVSDKNRGLTTP